MDYNNRKVDVLTGVLDQPKSIRFRNIDQFDVPIDENVYNRFRNFVYSAGEEDIYGEFKDMVNEDAINEEFVEILRLFEDMVKAKAVEVGLRTESIMNQLMDKHGTGE
jgi:hypothetical protein